MADKILRPITDVEIVEQMGENDTVLIEHGGEIKRTKGVVGGGSGKKYFIKSIWDEETGNNRYEWNGTPMSFEQLADMIRNCTLPDLYHIEIYEDEIVVVDPVCLMRFEAETDDYGDLIVPINYIGVIIEFWGSAVMLKSDGTFTTDF